MTHSPDLPLRRRLSWLLVFRCVVATILLLVVLAADLAHWPLQRLSSLLYITALATYGIVIILGLLLRHGTSAVVLSAVHLATSVMAAMVGVQGTGVIDSPFTFLFVLSVMDGAIVGGRRVALVLASASSIIYGAQLTLQLYNILPPLGVPLRELTHGVPKEKLISPASVALSVISHWSAFYLVALLSGFLADLLRREHEAATSTIQRLEAEVKLNEQLAMLGQFAAGLAHEIRNPLAAISGSLELLRRHQLTNPEATTLSNIVHREIDRLNKLLSDFLLYARPAPPVPLRLNLTTLLLDLNNMLRQEQPPKHHDLLLQSDTQVFVHGDPAQLQQVFLNVLRNAREASPAGRPIVCQLTPPSSRDLFATIDIINEGDPMAEEMLQHLFEPFCTNKPEGSGLGLAIAHRIIQAHHGNITYTRLTNRHRMRIRLPSSDLVSPTA